MTRLAIDNGLAMLLMASSARDAVTPVRRRMWIQRILVRLLNQGVHRPVTSQARFVVRNRRRGVSLMASRAWHGLMRLIFHRVGIGSASRRTKHEAGDGSRNEQMNLLLHDLLLVTFERPILWLRSSQRSRLRRWRRGQ